MRNTPDILCIGSVLWDVIGRSARPMRLGSDLPGEIIRLPGGVALNIAMALRRFGLQPALLSAVGTDPAGDALIAEAEGRELICDYMWRTTKLPTDSYMAIEAPGGVVAAIADARSLEAAGAQILAPLADGRLGTSTAPYPGRIALDGNLTEALLAEIAQSPLFAAADLRVAPASPGKAQRLAPFLGQGRATLYVNLEEAGLLCGGDFDDAQIAAEALVKKGAHRALVTNGAKEAAAARKDHCLRATPPKITPIRLTGAGDTFMAAHIAAEAAGRGNEEALTDALAASAAYVAGVTPI